METRLIHIFVTLDDNSGTTECSLPNLSFLSLHVINRIFVVFGLILYPFSKHPNDLAGALTSAVVNPATGVG